MDTSERDFLGRVLGFDDINMCGRGRLSLGEQPRRKQHSKEKKQEENQILNLFKKLQRLQQKAVN